MDFFGFGSDMRGWETIRAAASIAGNPPPRQNHENHARQQPAAGRLGDQRDDFRLIAADPDEVVQIAIRVGELVIAEIRGSKSLPPPLSIRHLCGCSDIQFPGRTAT